MKVKTPRQPLFENFTKRRDTAVANLVKGMWLLLMFPMCSPKTQGKSCPRSINGLGVWFLIELTSDSCVRMSGANMHLVTVHVNLGEHDPEPEQHLDKVSLQIATFIRCCSVLFWRKHLGRAHHQEGHPSEVFVKASWWYVCFSISSWAFLWVENGYRLFQERLHGGHDSCIHSAGLGTC